MWIILFRNLFAFEDGDTLYLTPATFRRWMQGDKPVIVKSLPTYFGELDLKIQPSPDGQTIDYSFSITPQGDQNKRKLEKVILFPRTASGRAIQDVQLNGKSITSFTRDAIVIPQPAQGREFKIHINVMAN